MFDPATASDIERALTLLRAHRRLSPGASRLLALVSGSTEVYTGHVAHDPDAAADDDFMAPVALMTLDEVGTAMRVSPATVKRAMRSGELKAIHVGAAVRVHPQDYLDYLDKKRQEAQ